MRSFIYCFVILFLFLKIGYGDSLNVTQLGFYNTPGNALGVAVVGQIAYVADESSGLRIINISNPIAPEEIGYYLTPGSAWAVAIVGQLAYVAAGTGGLRIIDISNSAMPTEIGYYAPPGDVLSLVVIGQYAYVADAVGLRIINITNPAAPVQVGFYATHDATRSVAVVGHIAYVADDRAGLRIIDISNPSVPVETAFYATEAAHGVAVVGQYAYVADYQYGLRIINISNPYIPFQSGYYNTPSVAWGVTISAQFAYVADYDGGLRIIDISNPAVPVEIGYYQTDGGSYCVATVGSLAYVANYANGLRIFDCSEAIGTTSPRLILNSPNGNESWRVFQNDTVRWTRDSLITVVKIELNRNYPSGIWEVLRDSTENDGIEAVYVTDPLSTHCRIRISTVGDTLSDISDWDFSITASQGYLALARINVPSSSLISWNAGTVECPQVSSEWFHLKNFGSEAIVVFQPQEPVSADFSRTTSCGNFFALAPGQMSPCSLRLTFDPASDGTYRDTLLIQSDAINGVDGSVRIPLSGSQISTPAVPQMVIQPQGEDIHLAWQAVTQSVGGCPVNVARYLVFYAPTSGGPFYYHGYTSGTTYTHVGVVTYAAGMYYQVVAYAGLPALLETLPQDRTLSQAEVMRRLAE
jgi:hypothetical protein